MQTNRNTILISRNDSTANFPVAHLIRAIEVANDTFHRFTEVDRDLDLFSLLGMRNLSAFVGEVYVASLAHQANDLLMKNPHQDGYPDLLLLDQFGRACLDRIRDRHDKASFSPFPGGGIEVKATCGDPPRLAVRQRRGLSMPEIGDTRAGIVTTYTWKAHHRETNNLIGVLWDFTGGIPEIVALFFSSELQVCDWGKIVHPREGGGRTTSVSIMKKSGVRKMTEGCLYCKNDPAISGFIEAYTHVHLNRILQ